jgi:hypothetical protein
MTRDEVQGATAVRLHQRDGWFDVVHVATHSVIVHVPDRADGVQQVGLPFESVIEVRR